jgi:hypothetical protein
MTTAMRAAGERRTSRLARIALCAVLTAAACGVRTPPRPPQATAPILSGTVDAVRSGSIVTVHWNRAERSADGRRLDDLAAFVVERRLESDGADALWQRIATIDVVDQDKIRRRHDFKYRDATAGNGKVEYRVLAVCADGQEGPPSAAVTATTASATTPPAAATPAP